MIVVEFLPTIGIQPREADELLRLVARLNSTNAPHSRLFHSATGTPTEMFNERVKAALVASARGLGAVDPARWYDAYQLAEDAATSLPTAINHGELFFQQIGWARAEGRRTLVMFDLETMSLRPRFTDVANVLVGLSELTGRDQRELFNAYLTALQECSGVAVNRQTAWEEMRLVRALSFFQSLPWLVAAGGDAQLSTAAVTTLLTLNDDLSALDILRV